MDLLSVVLKIKDTFLKIVDWVLKIAGQKRVPLEDYKDETVQIHINDLSPKMIEEKSKGAKFYWSEKMIHGYEKYFEIEGNTRRYFNW